MPGQTFAYLRVSKLDQDLEKNKADILKLANDTHLGHVQFIEEKISGNISWRKRQVATILENAHEGDAIIVSELSRLGRSMPGVHGNPFFGYAEGYPHLCRQRELATEQQHPEQDCSNGLCHGR